MQDANIFFLNILQKKGHILTMYPLLQQLYNPYQRKPNLIFRVLSSENNYLVQTQERVIKFV